MQNLLKKKYIIIATSLLAFGFIGYWLYSHAFIEISVADTTSDGEFTYVLVNQKNGTRNEVKSSKRSFKKLVSRGDYEVHVRQDKHSYLAIKQTGGFLGTTKSNATLRSESARTFIGNNPNTCMYLLYDRLASAPCNGLVEDFEVHMPATATIATHTKKAAGPAALLEGFFSGNHTAQAIVNAEAEVDGGGKVHARYSVTNEGVFDPNSYQKLDQLNPNKLYKFLEFDEGYAALSNDGDEAFYYTSFSQTPQPIEFKRPTTTGQQFRSTASGGGKLFIVYSNDLAEHAEFENPGGLRSHSEDFEKKNDNKEFSSTVLIYTKNNTRQIEVSGSVIQAASCGETKLCLRTADGQLNVYELANGSTEQTFSLSSITGMQNVGSDFYALTTDGVVSLDTQKEEGYMVYTFGSYDYCGQAENNNDLVVCIADERGNRRALSIDPKTELADAIDEKVAQLQKLPELKYVSVYGNYIHLAAELGRLDYQPSIGGFGYDPEIIKSTNAAIENEIKRLSIDTTKYTIVNPYK